MIDSSEAVSTTYRLHGFAQSGHTYKVALMLELCEARWQPVFVDYFGGRTRTPAHRRLNVMGEVPVLEHGSLVLSQSGVILEYLAAAFGRFGARDASERRELLRWLLFDNHKLSSQVGLVRYRRTFTDAGEDEVTRFLSARSEEALDVLERQLATRDFVLGKRPTIADLSLCSYLYWPDEIGIDMEGRPAVRAWLERIAELPRWRPAERLLPNVSPE